MTAGKESSPVSRSQARLDAITTCWSLLGRDGSPETVAAARNQLVLRYSPAIRAYVRAILRDADDADELSQDVLVRLLKGDFDGADPNRGRFRDLLKTAIRNMVRNHWSRQKRQRASPLAADEAELLADVENADDPWLEAWRKSMLDLAWSALADYEREHAGSVAYSVLRLRTEFPEETSDELALRLAKSLGKPVRADSIRQQLRRARCRYAELVLRETANGLAEPTSHRLEEELIALGLWEKIRDFLPNDWREAWDAE